MFKSKRKRVRSDSVLIEKSPLPTGNQKKESCNTKNAMKNFDYTTIADRQRTVIWSSDILLTGVVKPVNGITTLPLAANDV